jgi:hypothetical protein
LKNRTNTARILGLCHGKQVNVTANFVAVTPQIRVITVSGTDGTVGTVLL